MLSVNGGFYPFDRGQHRNPKGSRRAATKGFSYAENTSRRSYNQTKSSHRYIIDSGTGKGLDVTGSAEVGSG